MGNQRSAFSRENGSRELWGSRYRAQYQAESTNVSMVSTSRRAGPPQMGHFVLTQEDTLANGASPSPVSTSLTSMSGSFTGSCESGTGMPFPSGSSFGQYTMGIGVPQ